MEEVRYARFTSIPDRRVRRERAQMAAAAEEDVSVLSERIGELSISATEDDETTTTTAATGKSEAGDVDATARSREPRFCGFETRELYKLALNFYKGESARRFIFIFAESEMQCRIHVYLDCRLNQSICS